MSSSSSERGRGRFQETARSLTEKHRLTTQTPIRVFIVSMPSSFCSWDDDSGGVMLRMVHDRVYEQTTDIISILVGFISKS